MAYNTYTTEAIVCGSKDSYTSDRSYLLFTREAGMLWATARSVRVEKSKQRFALQDFSIIRVSLVKGKGGWRIGSVEAIMNPFMETNSREARAGLSVIIKLLRRFLHGEIAQSSIYDDAALALACIKDSEAEEVIVLQEQFMLRYLYQLGYIAPDQAYQFILDTPDPWSVPYTLPPKAHQAIKNAEAVSHL